MFEVRYQTYWSDFDAAGIVFFPHFFRFVAQAEEDLFLGARVDRVRLMQESHVLMPRVEAFAKFSKPIRSGAAIRVRLTPELQGHKTIRYNFVILDDQTSESLSYGYVTVVCVDATHFKATSIPEPIRKIIANGSQQDGKSE
jgi:acyl-CoA thioester hydrolase